MGRIFKTGFESKDLNVTLRGGASQGVFGATEAPATINKEMMLVNGNRHQDIIEFGSFIFDSNSMDILIMEILSNSEINSHMCLRGFFLYVALRSPRF